MNDYLIDKLKSEEETAYFNADFQHTEQMSEISGKKFVYVKAAQNRLVRFMPFIKAEFPDTEKSLGIIESNLWAIPDMESVYTNRGIDIKGRLLLKDDARLPVAGSVKARGGIHEVLKHAEDLAVKAGLLNPADDHSVFSSEEFKNFFSQYTIQVGSTGNLGLCIGIMGRTLGFHVIVHMSKDAREWKKNKLREAGAEVIEYDADYSEAVKKGREESDKDPFSYFVDDENSLELFMGYATAALRLKVQLYKANISVDKDHPLFVYLPCGVGGAPGGITYGLKQMYGDAVHCFFVEPVKAPSFIYSVACDGETRHVSEIGLDPAATIADGLAVGQASKLVADMVTPLLSGCMTVSDDKLSFYQKALHDIDEIYLEPSACAGFMGPEMIFGTEEGKKYLSDRGLSDKCENITHVIWATGGGLVPEKLRETN